MESIIVCNTGRDSLNRINLEKLCVDTLPLKLGGERIGPRSIDVKGERGVVANCYDDSITFVDIRNFKELENFKVGKYPKDVKWKEDYIYIACGDSNSLLLFNEKKKQLEMEIKVGDYPSSIAIDEKNSLIYVANMNSNSITIINRENFKVIREIALKNTPSKIIISKDGEEVYLCENSFKGKDMKGILSIYKTKEFLLKKKFEIGAFPMDIVEDKDILYISNFGDGSISLVNIKEQGKYKIVVGGMPKNILKIDDYIIASDYYRGEIFIVDERTLTKKIIAKGNEPNAMIKTNFLQ